jgi:hypothetical protein
MYPLVCPSNMVCIDDPTVPENVADMTGICAKTEMCGGFANIQCTTPGQICVHDSRDSLCDPRHGGADCAGLCVWPLDPIFGGFDPTFPDFEPFIVHSVPTDADLNPTPADVDPIISETD